MQNKIQEIIKQEVQKNEINIDTHHIDTISGAIFSQLIQYLSLTILEDLVNEYEGEFLTIIDTLIPIIEEYETKIDEILETHVQKIAQKISKSQ